MKIFLGRVTSGSKNKQQGGVRGTDPQGENLKSVGKNTSVADGSFLTDTSCSSSSSGSNASTEKEEDTTSTKHSGPVDLDEIDDELAQTMLIRYFEGSDDEELPSEVFKQSTNADSGSVYSSSISHDDSDGDLEFEDDDDANSGGGLGGPVDLDKLDDDYHYYDKALNDETDGLEAEDHGDSSPVDIDDMLELQLDFDSILDAHEDEFQVWRENRKVAIKFGESSRRKRKSSSWKKTETESLE
mmetsp:Transcript_12472/g.20092  ORF Transcript_12472/g.20092 Transcript_12472/m.20092 type:complete len:243 (-) Transcript_12472:313-1041(-)|eukprot:CAMPEP_0178751548 /NCGR_PEP_ID=MMETSP0744-20121128/10585_1 /TAXON_ID=913974 /ORGANISM="Nitzschia punctata, Strain CCMP561" /LENGTH=242 /DNA_ID=CAMNT_0020405201 /DNA_START=1154 /DNA_END=1882 /DNA_ORIENTATION=-